MKDITKFFKKTVPIVLLIFGCGHLFAQDDGAVEIPPLQTIIGIRPHAQPFVSNSDSAYLYQIGADNIIKVKTHGANNELKLMQHGNANTASINVSAKTLVHNTVQNGNGNVFMEFANAAQLNLERDILQNGNNQNLFIYGSNSLTESIQLNMQGNAQAMTIRSFN